jgi:hypothetical protein
VSSNCMQAALQQLAAAAGSHPSLRVLDLSSTALTDSCLKALTGQGSSWPWQHHAPCQQLQELNLSGNNGLSGAAVAQLARLLAAGACGMHALRRLDVSNCPGIGDTGEGPGALCAATEICIGTALCEAQTPSNNRHTRLQVVSRSCMSCVSAPQVLLAWQAASHPATAHWRHSACLVVRLLTREQQHWQQPSQAALRLLTRQQLRVPPAQAGGQHSTSAACRSCGWLTIRSQQQVRTQQATTLCDSPSLCCRHLTATYATPDVYTPLFLV